MSIKLKRKIGLNILGFVIPTVSIFFAYPILIKLIGNEAFGIFILANSIPEAINFFGSGIVAGTVKYIAEYNSAGKHRQFIPIIISSLIYYSIIASFSIIIIIFLSDLFLKNLDFKTVLYSDALKAFYLGAFQILFVLGTNIFVGYFKGLQKFAHSTLIRSMLTVNKYIFIILGLYLINNDIIVTMGLALISNIFTFVISIGMVIYDIRSRKLNILPIVTKKLNLMLKKMMKYVIMMSITSIGILIYFRSQRYIIGYLYGAVVVGNYAIAFAIASKIKAVITTGTEVLFPISSGLITENPRKVRILYYKMMISSLFFGILFALPFYIIPEGIITLWIGESNLVEIVSMLKVLMLGYLFLCLSPAPYHLANGIGNPTLNTVNIFLRAILYASLLIFFSNNHLLLIEIIWSFTITSFTIDALLWPIVIERYIWKKYKDVNVLFVDIIKKYQ
ncbi:oligosaccharide flippase family protein [bacterium]|nr:oligosaccharide flippase family protein [bacterium]